MTQRFFSPLRMLLPPSDLSLFNNTVTPIEVEAYDILKYRSSACDTSWVNYNKQISSEQSWLRSLLFFLLCIAVRTPLLRSPMSGRAPKRRLITPIPGQQLLRPFGFMFKMLWKPIFDFFPWCFGPDYRGGFELHNAEEVEKESHLLEELERLSLSGPRGSKERPHTSRSFTPLLDIPVDGYAESRDLRSPSSSAMLPNWLLARNDDPHPRLRTDIGTIRSVHFDEVSLHSTADRGRSASRNGHSKSKKDKSGERSKDGVFTLQSAARRSRPLLSQVFSSSPDQQAGSEQMNGHQAAAENGLNGSEPEQEYKLKTVSISKTKQSLGKWLWRGLIECLKKHLIF